MAGKVVTFYSFKGGVGRTMALANVAFLAAMNGKRVLMIDWDLEAPGLAYYFRGLIDPRSAQSIKKAPGLLDLVTRWVHSTGSVDSTSSLDLLFSELDSGEWFNDLVSSVIDESVFDEEFCLDFIGPGSNSIGVGRSVPYETALTQFSWNAFFDDHAGGRVIESLRSWCIAHYDYIFIDSRTGLADDAGICTVQMPDVVALCFVLNRQNIDGVAKVAGAIKSRRGDSIQVRTSPMRVSRSGTAEEADALSRATRELSRVGRLSVDDLERDLRRLNVQASDSVPFYETLAPIMATNAHRDLLTLNYLDLAVELCGEEFIIPDLPHNWLDVVRGRLEPTHATLEYVSSLTNAEPGRAVSDLHRLLENASADEKDGGVLDAEYVSALVNAAFLVAERVEDPIETVNLIDLSADILRDLYRSDAERWRALFASSLERLARVFSLMGLQEEEEVAALEELDGVLSAMKATVPVLVRRLPYRRRIARLNAQHGDDAQSSVGEVLQLISEIEISSHLPADVRAEVGLASADCALILGDLHAGADRRESAAREYEKGYKIGSAFGPFTARSELQRLMFELATRLTTYPDVLGVEAAADYAIDAAELSIGASSLVTHFVALIGVISASARASQLLPRFVDSVFLTQSRQGSSLASFFGRSARSFLVLLQTSLSIIRLIESEPKDIRSRVATLLGETLLSSVGWLRRRRDLGVQKTLERAGAEVLATLQEWERSTAGLIPVALNSAISSESAWLEKPRR